jgi:hypothetical protein
MQVISQAKKICCAGALLSTVLAGPLAAQGQGVKVALLPASQAVDPGTEFDLSMEVTRAGSSFNGFDAYIGYDPAALTLIPLSPLSQQEGSYFKAACSNRFHRFLQGSDRDTITDVLLCAGVSLTGPGQIYRLHFRASSTPRVTTVRFLPGLQFYNAGLYVNPDSSSNATITIGHPTGVGDSPIINPTLRAAPNPARTGTLFTVAMNRAGPQELSIRDLQGRVVRHLQQGIFEAGVRTVHWDRRTDSGRVAPAGLYLATLHASGRTFQTRVTVLN